MFWGLKGGKIRILLILLITTSFLFDFELEKVALAIKILTINSDIKKLNFHDFFSFVSLQAKQNYFKVGCDKE